MRILSFLFVLIFTFSSSAQSSKAKPPFDEGTRLAKSGNFEKALVSYRTALAASKDDAIDLKFLARLHYNLGVCEYRLGRAAKAIAELETAIELRGGEYAEAFYALGMAETARENWPKARIAFLGSIKTNSSNGETWFDLAYAYLSESDLENAEKSFRNAIRLKSIDTPLSHNNVGVILALRGEIDAAKMEFQTALRSSGGRLKIAVNNLKYCETHRSSISAAKVALTIAERSNQE